MLVRKKPEKAVSVLLARLSKAKNHALQVVADPELGSKFDDIQTQLDLMTDSLSKIKNWEKKVVDQLCVLEQVLDDDIFSFTDPTSQPQLNDKLILIQQDVTELKTLISTVDHKLTFKLGGMSFKPTNYDAGGGGDDDRGAAVSQEWTDLGVEAKIVDSDAMSTLCNTFHVRSASPCSQRMRPSRRGLSFTGGWERASSPSPATPQQRRSVRECFKSFSKRASLNPPPPPTPVVASSCTLGFGEC